MRAATFLFASILLVGPAVAQDEKSPDLQQQRHNQNDPPQQATEPGAKQTEPESGKTTTGSTRAKKSKKHQNVKQAHGTPAKPDQQ